uniref:Immunoglobulin V-set domain-containing protein n=1 Tax=Podarcis muralis TaxID=64176 RepID=A0A670JEY4_PODMU
EKSLAREKELIKQASSAIAFDGAAYNLICNLSSVSTEMIQLYQQFPGQGPRYLAGAYPGETEDTANPKGKLHFAKDKTSSTFSFSRVTLADAAVYFCALSDTVCSGGTVAMH